MPRLSDKMAKAVAAAEPIQSTGFEPLVPGKYIVKLEEVEARQTKAGDPAWNITFSDIRGLGGDEHGGKQFLWINLPKGAPPRGLTAPEKEKFAKAERMRRGQLNAFFAAFGYTPDSDTDEMLGEDCVVQLGIETIKQGPKTGEKTNRVFGVFPLDSVSTDGMAAGDDEDDSDDDDDF
jgi:hypothetical protein